MSRSLCLGFCLLFAAGLAGQTPPPAPETVAPEASGQFAAAQLDTLVGPVALYPDALVALILPAATTPVDVVMAARYLEAGGGSADEIAAQRWSDSVKGLAHYPAVVEWMDENLAWTQQLGQAVLGQRADVMAAIQRQRARALALGTLQSTPQLEVVQAGGFIFIEPPQSDVIYVPCYNPAVVFYPAGPFAYPWPCVTFGPPFAAGYWLDYGCDWAGGAIWIVSPPVRRRYWHEHPHGWRHPDFPRHQGTPAGWHTWHPPAGRPLPPSGVTWSHRPIVQPAPLTANARGFADRPAALRRWAAHPGAPAAVPAPRLAYVPAVPPAPAAPALARPAPPAYHYAPAAAPAYHWHSPPPADDHPSSGRKTEQP